MFQDVSFELRRGEILGFFGLVGSGRTDVMRCLFGADHFDAGEIVLHGARFAPRSPADAIRRGIGLLPEDRKQQGLAMALPVMQNVSMGNYRPLTSRGFIRLAEERAVAERYVKALNIKTPCDLPEGAAALGRQPAEGGDRPLAQPRHPASSSSTSRRSASTSGPRPRSTSSSRS